MKTGARTLTFSILNPAHPSSYDRIRLARLHAPRFGDPSKASLAGHVSFSEEVMSLVLIWDQVSRRCEWTLLET